MKLAKPIDTQIQLKRVAHVFQGGATLAVIASGKARPVIFTDRGVSALHALVTECSNVMKGATVFDRIVGKGAAALMIYGDIDAVYTPVISRPALEILEKSDITVGYETVIDHVVNRAGDGICPVEQLCAGTDSPAECVKRIETFLIEKDLRTAFPELADDITQ